MSPSIIHFSSFLLTTIRLGPAFLVPGGGATLYSEYDPLGKYPSLFLNFTPQFFLSFLGGFFLESINSSVFKTASSSSLGKLPGVIQEIEPLVLLSPFFNFPTLSLQLHATLFPLLNRPSSSLFAVCMPSPRRVFANLPSSLPAKAMASSAYFPNLAHLATGTRETQLRPRSHPLTWLPSVSFPVIHPDTSSNMRKSSVSLPRWAASFRICPEAT